jgi:hypothetical protein
MLFESDKARKLCLSTADIVLAMTHLTSDTSRIIINSYFAQYRLFEQNAVHYESTSNVYLQRY